MLVKTRVDQETVLLKDTAHNNKVVKATEIANSLMGSNCDATARQDRRHVGRDDTPSATNGTAAVAVVRGEAEHVDEIGERPKRKAAKEEEPEAPVR